MAAGSTYTPIQSYTLGSAQAQITFTSIPSTYTDLVLVMNGSMSSGSETARVRFNGSSSTVYSQTNLAGSGSAVASSRNSNQTSFRLGETYAGLGTTRWTVILNILNYSNTATYKTCLLYTSDAADE